MNKMDYDILKFRMEQAFMEAEKSSCLKKKVGGMLIDIKTFEIRGKGFGGAKTPCKECVRKTYEWQQDGCWSMHSEPKAIFDYFHRYGFTEFILNTIMLTTHGPCDQCIKYCHWFGIPIMIYSTPYHNDYSKWKNKIKIYELGENDLIEKV